MAAILRTSDFPPVARQNMVGLVGLAEGASERIKPDNRWLPLTRIFAACWNLHESSIFLKMGSQKVGFMSTLGNLSKGDDAKGTQSKI